MAELAAKILTKVTAKGAKKRFSRRIKSVQAYGVLRGPLAYLALRSASGSKKASTLPPLKDTLLVPKEPQAICLELDEMWSFVRQRANKRWVWLALCKQTKQVVACVIGGRGIATC